MYIRACVRVLRDKLNEEKRGRLLERGAFVELYFLVS